MKRWPWLVWLILLAASVLQITRTTVVTDVTSFLPGAADADQRLMADQLRDGLSTRIMLLGLRLEPQAGADALTAAQTAALSQASRGLRERLAADRAIAWASNGEIAAHETERGRLFAARYILTGGAGEAAPGERFGVAELGDAFARLERELVSARGPLIRPVAAADPTLESLGLVQKASGLAARLAGDGVWFTADGRAAVLLFETAARGQDIDALRKTMAAAENHAEAVLAHWPADQARPVLEFAGAGYFIVKSRDAIGRDAERLSLLATGLVALLLLWALRSPRFLGLAVIPVATGALAGFAAVGWVNGSIHGITLAFGVTLIGEAVDYAIYTFVQRDDQGTHAPRFWRQILLATMTSLIGFAAMLFSGFQGLQQLGLFSIVGLLVAAGSTRWLLPALLPRGAADGRGYQGIRWRHFEWLGVLGDRLSWLRIPLAVTALAMLVLLIQRNPTMWQDNLDALSASTASETSRDAQFRNDIGMPDLRTMVVVRGASREAALTSATRVAKLLDAQVAAGMLAGYDSPAVLLPPIEEQKRRQATLPDEATLRARVAEVLAGGKFQPRAFEPCVAAVAAAKSGAPLDRAYYGDTIIGRWLDAQIVTNDDGVAVLVLLHGVADPGAVRRALTGAGTAGVRLLDLKGDVETLVAGYRERTLRTALFGALGIVLLLALQLRKLRAIASMLATLVTTVVFTAWAILMIEGSLTIFNVVALLLVVGVASNYTMFFSTLSPEPGERRRASLSVLLAAASTFSAFAMLALSTSPVLAKIGTTVAIGALAGLAASMVFAPRRRKPS